MPLMRSDLAGWRDRASLIEASIREGNYKQAESAANSLIRDVTHKITGGPDAGRILAMPVSLRALARVGLHKEADALWDYQMTAALWPALRNVRLETYGPTGVRLIEMLAEQSPPSEPLDSKGPEDPPESAPAKSFKEITPPRAVRKPEIEFPSALSRVMKSGQVTIDLRIDETGRPISPAIHAGATQNALFLFAAMEGVRQWRFEPAKGDGKPIAVFYSLTVNFK